jgi:hypothetical protein
MCEECNKYIVTYHSILFVVCVSGGEGGGTGSFVVRLGVFLVGDSDACSHPKQKKMIERQHVDIAFAALHN